MQLLEGMSCAWSGCFSYSDASRDVDAMDCVMWYRAKTSVVLRILHCCCLMFYREKMCDNRAPGLGGLLFIEAKLGFRIPNPKIPGLRHLARRVHGPRVWSGCRVQVPLRPIVSGSSEYSGGDDD